MNLYNLWTALANFIIYIFQQMQTNQNYENERQRLQALDANLPESLPPIPQFLLELAYNDKKMREHRSMKNEKSSDE